MIDLVCRARNEGEKLGAHVDLGEKARCIVKNLEACRDFKPKIVYNKKKRCSTHPYIVISPGDY